MTTRRPSRLLPRLLDAAEVLLSPATWRNAFVVAALACLAASWAWGGLTPVGLLLGGILLAVLAGVVGNKTKEEQ